MCFMPAARHLKRDLSLAMTFVNDLKCSRMHRQAQAHAILQAASRLQKTFVHAWKDKDLQHFLAEFLISLTV